MCDTCKTDGATRRGFLTTALAGAAVMALPRALRAEDACAPFLAADQAATTPDAAINMLQAGNIRFVAGTSLHCDLLEEMKETSEKQTPFACVLACIDSRSAPEIVFDQQIGDIFVARVAGNVATPEIIGSFEYATKVAGAKAIVVLGHNHCGAVKGAVDRADVGANLTTLLAEIEPVVEATPLTGERSSKNGEFVQSVAQANVAANVAAMTANSPVLQKLVADGALKVVGAMYDIDTGVVTFI